jgi:hypothetical protein
MSNDHDDPNEGPLQLSGGSLVGNFTLTAGYIEAVNTFTFPATSGKAVVILNFSANPPTVWVDPDLAWDVAAKHFWNAVHRINGRPAPFPDID